MVEKKSTGINPVIKGGKRPGAGRKKGSPNKRTAALQAAVEAEGITPLAFLLQIMRDEVGDPRDRMAAAIAAAPYVHAKLAAIEHSGDMNLGVVIQATPLDERL